MVLALILLFVVLGAGMVVVGTITKTKWGINLSSVVCPVVGLRFPGFAGREVVGRPRGVDGRAIRAGRKLINGAGRCSRTHATDRQTRSPGAQHPLPLPAPVACLLRPRQPLGRPSPRRNRYPRTRRRRLLRQRLDLRDP